MLVGGAGFGLKRGAVFESALFEIAICVRLRIDVHRNGRMQQGERRLSQKVRRKTGSFYHTNLSQNSRNFLIKGGESLREWS